MGKMMIYAYLPRLFRSVKEQLTIGGNYETNGSGKFADTDQAALAKLRALGFNCIWAIGVIRHASRCAFPNEQIEADPAPTVKGEAGSPYAVTDYFDVAPYLAEDAAHRMDEFDALTERCHRAGMKLIIDFVPNHVARTYHSLSHEDFGLHDDRSVPFAHDNHFYWLPGEQLVLHGTPDYVEQPARATGNDRFTTAIGPNDWYETVKLNYGVDYCDWGGRSTHFEPIPDTWHKMTDMLLFWAAKGIDGFRCDMAEMVPHEFWKYATEKVKAQYPHIVFIGEVYDPNQYRTYLAAGFDYLYDKVGMYDCLRDVMCGHRPASDITRQWQATDDIREHVLYFLENHDEQRIASDFFCGNMQKGIPALIVSALFQRNPVMIYAGQEFGERGMDGEGFSGIDGRSTIFDYWSVDAIRKGFFERSKLSTEQLQLEKDYRTILTLCNSEKAVSEGKTFDLMYANEANEGFDSDRLFAFLRSSGNTTLLIVANFGETEAHVRVNIPAHAFDYMELKEGKKDMVDLLSGNHQTAILQRDSAIEMIVPALNGRVYKF